MLKLYQITLKTLCRTKIFWLCLAVVAIASINDACIGYYADGGNVLSFQTYVQTIHNSCSSTLLFYAMPFFSIVTTVMILTRDFNDNFFEIEKAAGQKNSIYVFSRLLALISLNVLIFIFLHAMCLHLYVLSTFGGVSGMNKLDYFFDSSIRLLRFDLFVGVPCILFFVCLSYFLGVLFKSGTLSAIFSFGYLILSDVLILFFRNTFPQIYFEYFTHLPEKLRHYLHYYDSEWFDFMINYTNTSFLDASFCVIFMLSVGAICTLLSYLGTLKRDV
jgi:hypothetical protein